MEILALARAAARSFALLAAIASPVLAADERVLFSERFDGAESVRQFLMSDPGAWRHARTNNNGVLELARQSQYKPVVRSPVNIALIRDKVFTDFVLEADLVQTGREYGHRDMCIYFGFQNPTNFYYVHVATKADPNAHNVFLVKNAPRTNIAKQTTQGVDWGLGVWHKVRIERNVATGSIRVFFDDMAKPIMVAEDKTFGAGYIGFGSFDDTGMIDNVRISGSSVETRPAAFFKGVE